MTRRLSHSFNLDGRLAAPQQSSQASGIRSVGAGNKKPAVEMRLRPHHLVFVDETSVNTKMVRLRGRALCGERLRANAPFGHWGTQTFIAGLRCMS